jgi:S-adenosylmethionine:tRNA ribosyltransferase-isomerase
MKIKLSDFNYLLPKELIAQNPANPRDHSRLLVLDKKSGRIEHKHFYDIVDFLHKGDLLVLNNSKVFPARLIGHKHLTGGRLEIFLLHKKHDQDFSEKKDVDRWICLVGGRGGKPGLKIEFNQKLSAMITQNNQDGSYEIEFNQAGKNLMREIEKIGHVPLPPYIKRELLKADQKDKQSYQTIYANDQKSGSVAAPTAGLHFTRKLLDKLKQKGVQIEYVTLHVGLGTFAPVKTEDVTMHKMHAECVELNKKTIEKIFKAKREGRRIIAVGTTSVRTLEAMEAELGIRNWKLEIKEKRKENNRVDYRRQNNLYFQTSIFIYPGYKFKIIDGMITNFHLPKSTLLMLVSALAGKQLIGQAYQAAIEQGYRFFSFGDAMLII